MTACTFLGKREIRVSIFREIPSFRQNPMLRKVLQINMKRASSSDQVSELLSTKRQNIWIPSTSVIPASRRNMTQRSRFLSIFFSSFILYLLISLCAGQPSGMGVCAVQTRRTISGALPSLKIRWISLRSIRISFP